MKKPTKTQISTLLVDLVYDIVGCFIYGVGMALIKIKVFM